MHTSDVLVIGGGIAGASVAYEVQKEVCATLIEAEPTLSYHSTGRSIALLMLNYGTAVVQHLARNSEPFLREPPPGFSDTPLLTHKPILWAVNKYGADQEVRHPDLKLPVALEKVSSIVVKKMCPILSDSYLERTTVFRDTSAYEIDIHALHSGFIREFKRTGGTVKSNARVTSLERGSHCWTLKTDAGTFQAPVIVNAAGAWCDRIAEMARLQTIGLTAMRRTIVMIDPPANVDVSGWPFVVDVDNEFYFKADAGRLLISPADETPAEPQDTQPEELDVAIALERFTAATNYQVDHLVRKWAGLRTFTCGRDPHVGWDDADDGFFWLAGLGGAGIMIAPALAKIAGECITGAKKLKAPMNILARVAA